MKKLIQRSKFHAEWNTLLAYLIPAIGISIAGLVLFIRWIMC